MRALIHAPYAQQPDLDDPGVKKTRYTYDANGNQDLSTDPLERTADNDYDPLNRLIRQIQDQGSGNGQINATVRYEYDARDNLRKVIDPKNLVTEYVYDGLNNQTQLISPDTGSTSYTFDAAGNRSSQTDARGVQSLYSYDALNRLTAITYPADPSKSIGFTYDQAQAGCPAHASYAAGRLTRIDDASGSTVLCHDGRGNLRQKTQTVRGRTLTLSYQYDRADRLTAITYPSGLQAHYSHDAQGRIQGVNLQHGSDNLTLIGQIAYLPFGPMQTIQFGNGETLTKQWDQNYWPQAIASGALDYQYQTDDIGNLTRIASSQEGTQHYAYDRLDRLSEVRDANQALIEAYRYDATGNRTEHTVQTASGPQTVNYGYPSSSHRLQSIDGQARSFDAAGNTLSGIPGYQGAQAEYDVRNRLNQVTDPMGPVRQRNDYNGRGERVLKSTGPAAPALPDHQGNGWVEGIAAYVYDEGGQILSRYQGHSEHYEEIVWVDSTPAARVQATSTTIQAIHLIHSDHLNSPRALTHARAQDGQAAGTTVWRWPLVATASNPQAGIPASNAFGALAPQEDPDGNGTLIKFDLRFPGQQADGETGLYYNYFRDYEAGVGRYVQSDPIGLWGGVSIYGYAATAPTNKIDPRGLDFHGVIHVYFQMRDTFPEIRPRGGLGCGDVGKGNSGITKAISRDMVVAQRFCDTPCLSKFEYIRLFFTLFHEGMHSTDSWWDDLALNEDWFGISAHHQSIIDREAYEMGRGSRGNDLGATPLWGNPVRGGPPHDMDRLYDEYLKKTPECQCG